jgi:ferredoxin-NADP reductase
MIRLVDRLLDHVTMYRLVLYYLFALVAAAIILSFAGLVPHGPLALTTSVTLILAACWITNWTFTRVFNVPANAESVYITALILALILDPAQLTDWRGIAAIMLASVWAIASKFIFAVGAKHVFNPAAVAVFMTALLLDHPATWWVGGNPFLLPATIVGGLIVVRKLRRVDLVATFVAVNVLTVIAGSGLSGSVTALRETFLSSPLLFFAFVMLTEPLTSPTRRRTRLIFAAIVGFLAAPDIHIGSFYFTPEAALLVGNLFTFVAGPRGRMALTLEKIEQTAADSYDFLFRAPRKLAFAPGQYLEWTLALDRSDSRGNRRYFTVASAPSEDALRLGVKFYPAPSAFKRRLAAMAAGDTIYATQVAGDFVMPRNPSTKLAFLAGGIGITPFRSMLWDLIERDEARPIIVLYGNERQQDFAYSDVLEAAWLRLGIPTYCAVAKDSRRGQYRGFIDARMVREAIPDFRERLFYVSGPQAMVASVRKMLIGLGVHRRQIKVDFFPGFA